MAGGPRNLDTRHLVGLNHLSKQMKKLQTSTSLKIMRNSAREAMAPVLKATRPRVPVGTRAHRTYKKNIVSPGFAQRSLRMITFVNKKTGTADAVIGLRKQAYYAIHYWKWGAYGKKRAPGDWLSPVFEGQSSEIVKRFADALRKRIADALR